MVVSPFRTQVIWIGCRKIAKQFTRLGQRCKGLIKDSHVSSPAPVPSRRHLLALRHCISEQAAVSLESELLNTTTSLAC